MEETKYQEKDKRFYEVSKDDLKWKPCLFCGAEITQVRKAFFECIHCKQTYIADKEDMRL